MQTSKTTAPNRASVTIAVYADTVATESSRDSVVWHPTGNFGDKTLIVDLTCFVRPNNHAVSTTDIVAMNDWLNAPGVKQQILGQEGLGLNSRLSKETHTKWTVPFRAFTVSRRLGAPQCHALLNSAILL